MKVLSSVLAASAACLAANNVQQASAVVANAAPEALEPSNESNPVFRSKEYDASKEYYVKGVGNVHPDHCCTPGAKTQGWIAGSIWAALSLVANWSLVDEAHVLCLLPRGWCEVSNKQSELRKGDKILSWESVLRTEELEKLKNFFGCGTFCVLFDALAQGAIVGLTQAMASGCVNKCGAAGYQAIRAVEYVGIVLWNVFHIPFCLTSKCFVAFCS
jgi:hypothetical protein